MRFVFVQIFFCFVVSMCYRGLVDGVVDESFNKSRRKKMKKGQSFREWFFFTRFREAIPDYLLRMYYNSFFVGFLAVSFIGILAYAGVEDDIIALFLSLCSLIVGVPYFFFDLTLRSKRSKYGVDYSKLTIVKRNKKRK